MIIDNDGDAELYSPNGQCNYKLAQTPVRQYNPVLVYANNRIIACGAEASCWEYNIKKDSWVTFTQATFKSENRHGVVHGNKLYVIDTTKAQVLDLGSNTWSTWPMPPNIFDTAPWLVGWKESIILFGGYNNPKGVQTYNTKTNTWTVQNSTNIPMETRLSSALLISRNEILVAGSEQSCCQYSAAKYSPQTDSWLKLQDSQINHKATRLVKLGSRIFAIYGYATQTVEEFFAANSTWSLVGVKPINFYNGYHSVVAVPAALFVRLPGGCQGVF